MAIVLYGVTIHKAAATGNLKTMKATLAKAEKWLAHHGNVASALEVLNLEIAKATIKTKTKPKAKTKLKRKRKK